MLATVTAPLVPGEQEETIGLAAALRMSAPLGGVMAAPANGPVTPCDGGDSTRSLTVAISYLHEEESTSPCRGRFFPMHKLEIRILAVPGQVAPGDGVAPSVVGSARRDSPRQQRSRSAPDGGSPRRDVDEPWEGSATPVVAVAS